VSVRKRREAGELERRRRSHRIRLEKLPLEGRKGRKVENESKRKSEVWLSWVEWVLGEMKDESDSCQRRVYVQSFGFFGRREGSIELSSSPSRSRLKDI
jgi:hypothetical protein